MAERPTFIASVHAASLHDSLQRATRIAPTKGAAYDRAAGILLEFREDSTVLIKATNTEITYRHVLNCAESSMSEVPARIRLPSTLLSGFVATLPMAGDQHVRFLRDSKGRIVVQYNKTSTKATMNEVTGEFPNIPAYDFDEMVSAGELAERIEQVSWAVGDNGVTAGIHIDGHSLTAISGTVAATVECSVGVDAPVTAHLSTIAPLVKSGSNVRMAARDGRLVVALDETAQITSTVLLDPWPNAVERLAGMDFPHSFTVNRGRWKEGLERMLVFVRNDRFPKMNLELSDGKMLLHFGASITGEAQDGCAIGSYSGPSDVTKFVFNPHLLIAALDAHPGTNVLVHFGGPRQPFMFTDPGSSYRAWVIGFDPGVA
jgi:DNA polymerase III sliding clamp (beta) subunit (PCNA family)